MKNFILISIILSTLPFNTLIKSKIDSLENELKILTTKEKSDISKKIGILNSLVYLYANKDPERALKSATMALNLAKQINNKKLIAFSTADIARINFEQGNYEISMELSKKSLNIFRSLNDKKGMSASLCGISGIYYRLNDYEKSLIYAQQSLKISEKFNYNNEIVSALNTIGAIYCKFKNYTLALEYFQKALTVNKDPKMQSYYLNNIGYLYQEKKDYKKALEYYQKSLYISEFLKNKKSMTYPIENMGVICHHMEDYYKALEHFQKALKIAKELGYKEFIANSYNNIADTYIKLKQYNKAIEYANKSYQVAKSIKSKDIILLNYNSFYKIYSAIGKYSDALHYHEQYTILKDSIMNIEKQNQMANLQIKSAIENNEKEIKIRNLEIKKKQDQIEKQRLILYIYILISIIIVTTLYFYFRNKNIKKKEALKQEVIKLEQKLLRSQMNPHFIFNSLNAIQNFIYEEQSKKATKYLVNFAKLIRLILENSREEYISLDKEIQTLQYYLELQELRFKDRFDYEIHLYKDVNTLNTYIPPMLAQPFIENAIEHGIFHSIIKGRIDIYFTLKENSLLFEIEDNGVGFKEATKLQEDQHQSLALSITKERLNNINQDKKQKITLNITDLKNTESKQGTRISFYIPFHTELKE